MDTAARASDLARFARALETQLQALQNVSSRRYRRAYGKSGVTWRSGVLQRVLALAEPYYVSRDCGELFSSVPDYELRQQDPLTPAGWALLEEPLELGGGWRMDAFLWLAAEERIELWEFAYLTEYGYGLFPLGSFWMEYGSGLTVIPQDAKARDRALRAWGLYIRGFFAFCKQRKPMMVRADGKLRGKNDADLRRIRVVRLRARASEPRPPGVLGHEVEWSKRWIVRSHWRDQWYPSEQRHRPVLVPSYVKGPPDKPLDDPARLFAVVD